MMDYNLLYSNITGFSPYSYQKEVAKLLLSGKNVILSVPTGAGKTWASIMPFLFAKINNRIDFPQKLIYSLPLRTLTNSIYSDINIALNNQKIQSQYSELNNLTSIQTGEYHDDPYFEKDIIFSTIDQTLSSFLCFPLSLSKRQANINAGSLIGSYLIFDEFHLLDPKLSMATSLGMIKLLKNLCRVCIMTATLTDDYIQFIKKELDFEVVSIKDFPDDIKRINSLKPAIGKFIKKSISVITDKKINIHDILSNHKNKTIVICNRVETAQNIYSELENNKSKETTLLCIHSRYFDTDRKNKELQISEYFGKHSSLKDVILVSTQVIEAGMDISCDTMHSEISPINSLLQRAGRCARFENEYGDIFIYDVLNLEDREKIAIDSDDINDKKEIQKLNNKYLPYSKELCENSLKELSKYSFIDEKNALELVNLVLKEEENYRIDCITSKLYNLEKIKDSWNDCNMSHYRETIRDIQSIEIVLIDLENCENKRIIPWMYETVSVYKWSFISWAKQFEENKIDPDDWIYAEVVYGDESVFDFEWQEKNLTYLQRLPFEKIKNHYDVIFVDNRYFDYSNAGLIVKQNRNNNISPLKKKIKKENESMSYIKDTFYQHNKALINCFMTEFSPHLKFAFLELDRYWKDKIDWEKLIQFTICLHDYGKLNVAWQKPMKEFQKCKTATYNSAEMLAHTDFNDDTDRELAKKCRIKNKPPHAGIGAMQAYEILYDSHSQDIAKVVSNAILKHHSIDTKSFADFYIPQTHLNEIKLLFEEYKFKSEFITKEKGELLDDILPSNEREWILYFFIVRILRLCDQKATKCLEKYYKS